MRGEDHSNDHGPSTGDAASRRRALVAGAGGFIGGHLVADLVARGYGEVVAVDVKPLDEWFLISPDVDNRTLDLKLYENAVSSTARCTDVFNLAADMGGMGFIENNKAACMLNVLINTHLLMGARDAGVDRFFFASSACVYNADKQRSAEVGGLHESDAYPAMPEDGYGWEKLFAERMCRHFTEDFGLRTRVARFHNIYGPHGSYEGGREKAPAAISRKVAEAALSGDPRITIWGTGRQTRSFTYIDDCIEGIHRVHAGDFADPLNLGSTEKVTINGLVDLVESIGGVHLERTYDLRAPTGVNGRNSDNRLIREHLGWEPTTSLREGMEATYAWVFEQISRRSRQACPPFSSSTSSTRPT